MKNTKHKILLQLLFTGLVALGFSSCSKDEGKGGDAAIHGFVYYIVNNGDIVNDGMGGYKFELDTIPAAGQTVYIVYGAENSVSDDDIKTNGEGYYKFDYLREGNYLLYAFSDSSDQKSTIYRSLKIGKNGSHFADNIFLENGKNSKCAGLVGKVNILYKNEDDYAEGLDEKVYIRKENFGGFDKADIEKGGFYRFSKLEPNTTYEVWVASETKKDYAKTAVGYTITTGAAGTVLNMVPTPIEMSVY